MIEIKKIDGGKIMTTKQIAKSQDKMQGKAIISTWCTPKVKVYFLVGISVNKDKLISMRDNDDYADYMPDYHFEVKDENGEKEYLDGHGGTEYVVFDDLETARKSAKTLNDIEKIDFARRDIKQILDSLNKVRFSEEICPDVRNAIKKAKKELNHALNACENRNDELLELIGYKKPKWGKIEIKKL